MSLYNRLHAVAELAGLAVVLLAAAAGLLPLPLSNCYNRPRNLGDDRGAPPKRRSPP